MQEKNLTLLCHCVRQLFSKLRDLAPYQIVGKKSRPLVEAESDAPCAALGYRMTRPLDRLTPEEAGVGRVMEDIVLNPDH
ncbi:MAG: hypothetical protein KC877_00555 [Candidatus Kaiserbacteria bacterium]|nr:hypothetical protein [Candidatus Kaiserbacteria bacterium]MCB9816549.1 hypothetical protein [Candidatus Nomurabacteria bacterium]